MPGQGTGFGSWSSTCIPVWPEISRSSNNSPSMPLTQVNTHLKYTYLSRRVCNSANQQMNPVNKVITVHLEQPNGVEVGGGGEESFKWM